MKFTRLWGDVWTQGYFIHRRPLARFCISQLRFLYWLVLSPIYKLLIVLVKHRKTNYTYEVGICAIFKDEAPFLKEWIEYHLLIGVDHFYLYNNFSSDNYLDVLLEYINQGIVTLTNWPIQGNDNAQNKSYADCLYRFRDETHWIALIDLDEFIHIKKFNSIKVWLQKYQKYPSVYLFWKHFGTTGIIEHNPDDLVIEEYTSCWERLCNTGKSIVNNDFYFPEARGHVIKARLKLCGLYIYIPGVNDNKKFNYEWYPFWIKDVSAQINHYYIRGFEDRYYKSFKRGFACPDRTEDHYEYDRITPYELACTTREYTIQRHLTSLKNRLRKVEL